MARRSQSQRILFFTWRSILRRFVDTVSELAEGGHEVVIASPSQMPRKLPKRLRSFPNVRLAVYDEVSDPEYGRAIATLRQARDYAWYLSPEQGIASFNRRHALERLVHSASGGARKADPSWPDPLIQLEAAELSGISDAIGELDRRIPPDPGILELIRAEGPDLVVVTPLIKQRYHQTEIVKAAAVLGVPSGFLVYSWDNLSSKGRLHAAPDRTFVWNELQRGEAVDLHGLDPETIVVTGAPHWDAFFEMRPTSDRAEFCAGLGFDPNLPIVLYLGSTVRLGPDERRLFENWVDAVRRAAAPLGDANILFRAHPDWGVVERWPDRSRVGERVASVAADQKPGQSDQSLFDQLHHAAAAVGLNTSAQIEASIVGKPVYTFPAGESAPGQAGSLHFYYLLENRGGVVHYAESLAEHVEQLRRGVAGEYDRAAIRRFSETFVRPRGLDRPVSPILAQELLDLAQAGRPEERASRAWLRPRANRRPATKAAGAR